MNNILPSPEEQKRIERAYKRNQKRTRKGLPPIIIAEPPDCLFEKTRIPEFIRKLLHIKRKLKLQEPMY